MESFVPQFGPYTPDIEISTFDGLQVATAMENKENEHAPSIRGTVALPDDSVAEWHYLLEQAKGLLLIGVEKASLQLGVPFRKPDNRDQVGEVQTGGWRNRTVA